MNKQRWAFIYAILLVAGLSGYLYWKQSTITDPYINQKNSQNQNAITATDALITRLEKQLADNPEALKSYISLANAYNQKVRESADVGYYQKISDLMDRAESAFPNHPDIYSTRANVLLGRHHFYEALALIEKSIRLNPREPLYYSIAADGYIETGQYDKAVEATDIMLSLKPGSLAYTRAAYLRELYGDIDGAIELMEAAADTTSSFPENSAWTYTELGKLYARSDSAAAQRAFESALKIIPDYPPAIAYLGKLAAGKQNYTAAITYFEKAFSLLPIAQYAIDLGDAHRKANDQAKAIQYYSLAKIAFSASKSSGVDTDLEEAVFLLDRDLDIEIALQKAKAAYEKRPGIFAADTLAWGYYKNGQMTEAIKYGKEAMRIPHKSGEIFYHQSLISLAAGDSKKAAEYADKAFQFDPHFSILFTAN